MKPTEAVMLTGYLRAHFPSQPVDEFTTEALEELLAPYPAIDCKRAVLNIAERGEKWCSPTDVRAEVRRIREKRIAEYGVIQPPADLDPDNVVGYRQWLNASYRAIANGDVTAPPAIEAGSKHDVIAELGHVGRSVTDAIADPIKAARDAAAAAKYVPSDEESAE